MNLISRTSVHQLARWIIQNEGIVIFDTRSFMEYNTTHISSALNAGGNRSFKRKLILNQSILRTFLAALVGVSVEELIAIHAIVLYDQHSNDASTLQTGSFVHFFVGQVCSLFPNAKFLEGGLLGFQAAYPELCWQHADKRPDEEYVHVEDDSELANLLDECLVRMSLPSCSTPSSYSSSRLLSTSSSTGSSVDSGVILSSTESRCKRLCASVSRTPSAPISRPFFATISPEDLSKRPTRIRPATLSLCCSDALPPSSSSSALPTVLLPEITTTASSTPFPELPPIISLGSPARSPFASSYRSMCASLSRSREIFGFPTPALSRQSSREKGTTVSAAISKQDFESPRPTRVLPHLVLGCQADAMSEEVCREYGITHVINVSADGPVSPHVNNFLRIPIHDMVQSDIVPYLSKAFRLLDSVRDSKGCVLIHCFAGISRSPTLAIAYLMRTKNLTFQSAYNMVKIKRPQIAPNLSFVQQLENFEKSLPKTHPILGRPASLSFMMMDTSSEDIRPLEFSPDANIKPLILNSIVQRPTIKHDYTSVFVPRSRRFATSSVSTTTTTTTSSSTSSPSIASKKRDRPQNLFPKTPTKIGGDSELNEVDPVQQRTHKRSRLFFPLANSLLPSPSTGISQLALSSPLSEVIPPLPPPPPPPLSPTSPSAKRRISVGIENGGVEQLHKVGGARAWEFIQSSTRLDIVETSDIYDDSDVSETSSCKSASNPTIRTVLSASANRGPVLTTCVSWQSLSEAATCRHQESSCNSSISSSSNNGHTPSFPVS